MEKLLNFRLLAEGMKNTEGKGIKNIYRSADPSSATVSDVNYLVENNILDIIDLRSLHEINKLPVISDERVKRVHINIIDEAKQNQMSQFKFEEMSNFMVDLYATDFVETEGFKEEMAFILGLNGSPFLFHCTAGKDRTGVTGAILMHILGFSKEQILEEYLKIDQLLVTAIKTKIMSDFEKHNIVIDEVAEKIINDTCSVKRDFIEAFFEGVTKNYSSFDKYIEDKLKLTSEDREVLKDYYLN